MPTMTIRVTNSTFESVAPGEFDELHDAYRAAVAAGLKIAADEVTAGATSSVVQIAVDLVGQRAAMLGAVAVSTARLLAPTST